MFNIISNILLICSYLSSIGIFLTFIIKYYSNFSEIEYIWFCSKILTIQKIVDDNNNKNKAFYDYKNGTKYILIEGYQKYLNYITKDGCKENYRQCGILDTYGNRFCYRDKEECPINEIIRDSSSKKNDYLSDGYYYYRINNSDNYYYYKRGLIDRGIIVYWNSSVSWPLYINEKNFIFDEDAFEEKFGSLNYHNIAYISKQVIDESIDWVENFEKNSAKIERIHKLMKFINEKIYDDENNIDKNVTKIYGNEYVKRYLGFENEESIKNFKRITFSLYKIRFPNYIAIVFSFISIIFFIGLIIINIFSIYFSLNNENFDKLKKYNIVISIILYCPTFLGYLIYCSVIYKQKYKNESIEYAKKVRADKFIEDFLKDFIEHFRNNTLIICSIIFFIISGLLFIIGWIISSFNERYQYNRFHRIQRRDIFQSRSAIIRYTNNTNNIRTDRQNIEIFAVNFISFDQTINFPMACKSSDNFTELEKKLYIEYPDLKKKNIYFFANGKLIERSSTLEQNNIKSGNAILIKENELN